MKNTHQIVSDIGIEVLQENLGVGYTAIKNAESRGFLPAAWFNVVERLCLERGMECPRSLFNFKVPPNEIACLPNHASTKPQ